jgi:hypothetical protein
MNIDIPGNITLFDELVGGIPDSVVFRIAVQRIDLVLERFERPLHSVAGAAFFEFVETAPNDELGNGDLNASRMTSAIAIILSVVTRKESV